MKIEAISAANLKPLTILMLQLWPECSFEEEYENCRKMLHSQKETAMLAKTGTGLYAGFISLSLRNDHVEGVRSSPAGYLEGIYVLPEFRKQGIGSRLLQAGEDWCQARGCREMGSDAEWSNTGSQTFHRKAGFNEVNRIICYHKSLTNHPSS